MRLSRDKDRALVGAPKKKQGIFIVAVFVPNGFPCSNTIVGYRFGRGWLARQNSRLPSARRRKRDAACRGGCRKSFELKFDLNRPRSPSRPTSPRSFQRSSSSQLEGRSDKRGCEGRLRSSTSSKLRHGGRGTRRFPILPSRRQPRVSAGPPAMFAAPAPVRIRANEAGRHEARNDKNLLRYLSRRSNLIASPADTPSIPRAGLQARNTAAACQ